MIVNYVNIDPDRRRVHCRAAGTWTVATATAYRSRMREIAATMHRISGSFDGMTDLTGLAVHAKDVAPIVGEGANMLRNAHLGRYAMVVPGALMRIQIKRIVANHAALRFFDAADEALAWLDWEASDRVMAPPRFV